MQGSLEIQYKIFTEMICITDEIIEQQMGIRKATENLLDKNNLLQMKSGELNKVLETSQKQLQTMTTIPIDLINELASTVRQMKEDQQEKFEELLKSLEEVHKKTGKQKCLASRKESRGKHIDEISNGLNGDGSKQINVLENCDLKNVMQDEESKKSSKAFHHYQNANGIEQRSGDSVQPSRSSVVKNNEQGDQEEKGKPTITSIDTSMDLLINCN